LKGGEPVSALTDVRGTAHVRKNRGAWAEAAADPSRYVSDGKAVVLPSYEEVASDKMAFAKMSRMLQYETNAHNARPLVQPHGDEAVYFNPPALPLAEDEMDGLYDLPFTRRAHWSYGDERIPAFETVRHSIVTMRGCFGGCTFCSITEHEGRIIQSRSADGVLREVRAMSRMDGFRGTITDVGGPTANMYKMRCKDDATEHACRRLSCVHPGICENLVTDHDPLVDLLRRIRKEPGVEHVYVASGVRYDLAERSPEFIRELARHHTGGQLSVAPEHTNPEVLDKMKKPPIEHYERFVQSFCRASEQAGKQQYLVPYFIAAHPGSTMRDTIDLALWLKRQNLRPRQVQEFIPTPMAIATAMYFTGIDPLTMQPVPVVRDLREKKMMKALLYWWDEGQHDLAREALRRAGRADLIGRAPSCLVPPERPGRARTARRAS
ncbi:MAG: YgiQ family radical SAM protein, partial [Polyangiaceae bacterium]|nr:YgiQ family radical SAM protein [Polyangiaceae bacterium]